MLIDYTEEEAIGIQFYGVGNSIIENNIVIRTDRTNYRDQGIANWINCWQPASVSHDNNILGNIIYTGLDVGIISHSNQHPIENILIKNNALIDSGRNPFLINSGNNTIVDKNTFVNHNICQNGVLLQYKQEEPVVCDAGCGSQCFKDGGWSLKNGVWKNNNIINTTGYGMEYDSLGCSFPNCLPPSNSYNNLYNNSKGNYVGLSQGIGEIFINPNYDTITYGKGAYLMIPPALKGQGESGADIGAEVLYRYQDGVLTNQPLWPWPMEDRICAETGYSVTYESGYAGCLNGGGIWKTLYNYGIPPSCIPTAPLCNHICPAGCSVSQDPDCGCLGGNFCCGVIGCDNANDSDCPSAALCSNLSCQAANSVFPCACGTAAADAANSWCCAGNNNVYANQAACQTGMCTPAGICPANTGNCDMDVNTGPGGCEADLLTDVNNCGHCGVRCNGICQNGLCVEIQGGIIPCGRISDNCSTSIDERAPCNLCHIVILANNVINLLIKLAGIFALLALVVGGFLYVISAGDVSSISNAKNGITKALWGFVIILIVWILINILMVIFGFEDPFGDGRWNVINCNIPATTCSFSCGDGTVQPTEECERTETFADFQARTGGTVAEWTEMKGKCSFGCALKCLSDPLEDKIGEGCYDPVDSTGNPCQKGKYTCEVDSNTVQCINIFNNPAYSWDPDFLGFDLYDYCCDSRSAEFADGDINGAPFTIVKAAVGDLETGATGWMGTPTCPPAAANLGTGVWCGGDPHAGFGAGMGFRCDNVCKNVGKICVGVGLTDPAVNSCIYIQHDLGSTPGGCNNDGKTAISMDLPANQASTNCKAWFSMFYYSNKNGTGLHYSTGYDKYVYYCADNDPGSYWGTFGGGYSGFNITPNNATCRPTTPDTCGFHGFDLIETACYCL